MLDRRIRKKYFIDKNFQSKFILEFCSIVLVSSIVITGLILVMTQDSTTVAIYNTKVHVEQTADFIKPIVVSVIIAVTILTAIGTILLTLFISHRIAGPLFRLKREVDTIAKGSLKVDFSLRSKDQLKDLSASLQKMTHVIRDNHNNLAIQVNILKGYLEERDYNLLKKDKEKIAQIVQYIEDEVKFFKK